MFSDPLVMTRDYTTLTANAGSNLSLPASERAADHSTYRGLDAALNDHVVFIGHQYGRRTRITARYSVSGYSPSLGVPDTNTIFTQSVYVVADVPPGGPIHSAGTETNIFRKQCVWVGSMLVAVAADPTFLRAVNGET